MKARKLFTGLGIFAVTVVAGTISYWHQSTLARHHGQPGPLAAMWPLCVDGLVMSCGIAIATDRADGMRPRTWAVAGFWLGVGVSVVTNWLATSGGAIAHGVSAFPAIAFLITVEALSSKPRPRAVSVIHSTEAAISAAKSEVTPQIEAAKPKGRKAAPKAAKVADVVATRPDLSTTEAARLAGVSPRTARRVVNGHATPDLLAEVSS